MPFKTWSIGEEVLANDFNSYVQSQTVARFATAAARTTAIPTPVLNQLTLLDNRIGAVQHWNGTAWVDTVPFFQSGVVTVSFDASAQGNITYPVAFPAPGISSLIAVLNQNPGFLFPVAASLSQVTVRAYQPSGALWPNVTVPVSYVAFGPRP
jgi:hypothetical protein